MVSFETFSPVNFPSLTDCSNSLAAISSVGLCCEYQIWQTSATTATISTYQMIWLPPLFSDRGLFGCPPEGLGSFPDELLLSGLDITELYVPPGDRSTPASGGRNARPLLATGALIRSVHANIAVFPCPRPAQRPGRSKRAGDAVERRLQRFCLDPKIRCCFSISGQPETASRSACIKSPS